MPATPPVDFKAQGGNAPQVRKIDYAQIASKHGGVSHSAEQPFPPELERIRNAIGVQFVQGKPMKGYGGESVIASVAAHEPHKIEINDKTRWNQAPRQLEGHEIVHLWRNQLPPGIQKQAAHVDTSKPYDISDIEDLRSKGHTLATIPEEKAARIVQDYMVYPQLRKQLQPWMDDLNTVPLSVMNPTSPDQQGINTTPRMPIPPIQAYTLPELKKEAEKRRPVR